MTDLWNLERRLWTEGIAAYEELMAPDCIMAFGPMGILPRDRVIESLKQAPRWTDVTMSEPLTTTPTPNVTVLAYHARARRAAGEHYTAVCTSTYIRQGTAWRIAQHQQTPST